MRKRIAALFVAYVVLVCPVNVYAEGIAVPKPIADFLDGASEVINGIEGIFSQAKESIASIFSQESKTQLGAAYRGAANPTEEGAASEEYPVYAASIEGALINTAPAFPVPAPSGISYQEAKQLAEDAATKAILVSLIISRSGSGYTQDLTERFNQLNRNIRNSFEQASEEDPIDNLSGITISNSALEDVSINTDQAAAFTGGLSASQGSFDTLGIGTTTPSDTLALNGAFFLSPITPTETTARLYNMGGDLYWNGSLIGGASAGTWGTNGSDVYRVGGNVGVGTSTPQHALDVVGSVNVSVFDQNNRTTGLTINGGQAIFSNFGNSSNLFVGNAVGANTTGSIAYYNTIFGLDSGANIPDASSGGGYANSFFGYAAGRANTLGLANTFIGNNAGYSNTTGGYNTLIGANAGNGSISLTTGHDNVFIGYGAGGVTSGSNNIAIGGKSVSVASSTDSNQLNIQNILFGINNAGIGNTLSTGNIGIGISNPARGKLHIKQSGSTYLDGLAIENVGGADDSFLSVRGDGTKFIYEATYSSTGSYKPIAFYTAGLDRLRINADGNVGIGTTSPYAKLSITNTGTDPSFLVEDSTSPDSSPFIIDASGYVGIGTTTPILPFDVVAPSGAGIATARISNYPSNVYTSLTTAQQGMPVLTLVNRATAGNRGGLHMYEGSRNSGTFLVSSAVSRASWSAGAYASGTEHQGTFNPTETTASGIVQNVGNIQFYSGTGLTAGVSAAFTETMRITSAGNVGIGTSTPWAKFSLAGSAGGTIPLFSVSTSTAGATTTAFHIDSSGRVGIGQAAASDPLDVVGTLAVKNPTLGRWVTLDYTNFDARLMTTSGDDLILGTAGADVINIDGDLAFRNVTISSTTTLGAGTQLILPSTGSVGAPALAFTGDPSSGLYRITSGRLGLALTGTEILDVRAAAFEIKNVTQTILGGNAGVGSSTPWAKLSVTNTGTGPSFMVSDSADPDTTPFVIDASGNVGVGTIIPSARLHSAVAGGGSSAITIPAPVDTSAIFEAGVGGGATNRVHFIGPGGTILHFGTAVSPDSGYLWYQQNQNAFSFSSNLGIATTSPWRTLSVSGTVAFPSLSVAGASGDALCLGPGGEVVVNSGAQTCTVSSERFKHAIETLSVDEAGSIISSLRPVSFKTNDTNEPRLGLIAEEVAEIDDRLIFTEPDGTPRGVRYEDIVPVLIAAFQNQASQIASLMGSTTQAIANGTEAVFNSIFAETIVAGNLKADSLDVEDDATVGGTMRASVLCAGSICVTESELGELLQQAGLGDDDEEENEDNSEESDDEGDTDTPPESDEEDAPLNEPVPEAEIEDETTEEETDTNSNSDTDLES